MRTCCIRCDGVAPLFTKPFLLRRSAAFSLAWLVTFVMDALCAALPPADFADHAIRAAAAGRPRRFRRGFASARNTRFAFLYIWGCVVMWQQYNHPS